MAGGRPTKYKKEYAEQARKLCGNFGATDKKLAEFFGVSEQTVNAWKKAQPEFLESLKAKDVADDAVENSLYNTALDGNTTAQIFWLKNRRARQWRDKQEIDHRSGDGSMAPQRIEIVTPESK